MYNLVATAYRAESSVEVSLSGMLANSCVTADITGTYPGSVVYAVDPNEAQVFIEEKLRPGSEICLTALVPWMRSVVIPNASNYATISFFLNGKYHSSLSINAAPTRYRVISLVGFETPTGCSVVPEDMAVLAIYKTVFEPSSLEECKSWIDENCGAAVLDHENRLSSLLRQASQIPDIDTPASKKGSKLKDR